MGRLPPLGALRACEATARYLSVSRAAEELHVTPAAVSQQVRSLEDWLGVRLFIRTRGKLRLTPAGEVYLSRATAVFRQLRDATEQVAVESPRATITIAAPASFAAKWLAPRIDSFKSAFPTMHLRIQALTQPIVFNQQLMDVGVAYGWDQEGDLLRSPLLSYEIFPVCAPESSGFVPLDKPEDLFSYPLIEDEGIKTNDRVDWRAWFAAAGVRPKRQWSPSIWLSSAAGALEAVAFGHGISLTRSVLVERDLACGRLTRLFTTSLPGALTYDLVHSPEAASSRKVMEVKAWLKEEASMSPGAL